MREFLVTVVTYLIFIHASPGQYASGKTIVDDSQNVITDFDDWSYKLSSTITIADIKEHIYTLASDEFEGRETGTEGNTRAAQYIADKFGQLGLQEINPNGGYFQPVAFTFSSLMKTSLTIGNSDYKLLRDFVVFPQFTNSADLSSDEILFLGYGIQDAAYSDYEDVDVSGKVLMVFDGEPTNKDGISLLTGSSEKSNWSEDWKLKSALAKKKGAKMLIIIANDLKSLVAENRSALLNRVTELGDYSDTSALGVNTVFLSPKIAEEILGTHKDEIVRKRDAVVTGSREQLNLTIARACQARYVISREVLAGQNVLGYIEGTDKKEELVIVSGHYDHIGKRGDQIYNGADDNSSGTTAVLEIAEALATAKRMGNGPRRSVLCLLVTGEEKGLLGSEYYTQKPFFPLENTVVDVNIDMIGRWGKEYKDESEPYIYVIGSDRLSTDLHHINETVNQKYSHLLLDYKYNDERDPNRFYYRSDHFNFAKNGIPSIFFFNGVHADYHRLTDTPDKIDLTLMQHRARHIFHLVWELSNRKDRIRLVEGEGTSS